MTKGYFKIRLLMLCCTLLVLATAGASKACTTAPVTSGTVGYQSQNRYIMSLSSAAQPYKLHFTWGYTATGNYGGGGDIDFGAGSDAQAHFGTACETALGEVSPGTGDCAGTNGWASTGASDRIYDLALPNGTAPDGTLVQRWFINGVKVAEIRNFASNFISTWHFSNGLSKVRSDNVGDSWLYFDGFNNGAWLTKSLNQHNSCG